MSEDREEINRRTLLNQSAVEHRAVLGGVVGTSERPSATEFGAGDTAYVDASSGSAKVYGGVCAGDPHEIGKVDHCVVGTADHACHVPTVGEFVYVAWNSDSYPNGYVSDSALSERPPG